VLTRRHLRCTECLNELACNNVVQQRIVYRSWDGNPVNTKSWLRSDKCLGNAVARALASHCNMF